MKYGPSLLVSLLSVPCSSCVQVKKEPFLAVSQLSNNSVSDFYSVKPLKSLLRVPY